MVDWLVGAVSNVSESTFSILLLCSHLLVDQPEGMQGTWDPSEKSQQEVDQKVTTASSDECNGHWWEQKCKEHGDDIRTSNRHDGDRYSSGMGVVVVREGKVVKICREGLVDESCVDRKSVV